MVLQRKVTRMTRPGGPAAGPGGELHCSRASLNAGASAQIFKRGRGKADTRWNMGILRIQLA